MGISVEAVITDSDLALVRTEEFPANKERQDLAGEDLLEPRVINPGDEMEDARLVRSALGHQETEVGGEVFLRKLPD